MVRVSVETEALVAALPPHSGIRGPVFRVPLGAARFPGAKMIKMIIAAPIPPRMIILIILIIFVLIRLIRLIRLITLIRLIRCGAL